MTGILIRRGSFETPSQRKAHEDGRRREDVLIPEMPRTTAATRNLKK